MNEGEEGRRRRRKEEKRRSMKGEERATNRWKGEIRKKKEERMPMKT